MKRVLLVCPYKKVCECVGDGYDREGFILLESGDLTCLNWNVLVTKDTLKKLDDLDIHPRIRRIQKPKKVKILTPEQAERLKKSRTKYINSEKGKLALQKYYLSNKGQETHQRQSEQVKLFRRFATWRKTNPTGKMSEFLKEYKPDESI